MAESDEERSPANDAESASAGSDNAALAETTASQTEPLTAPVGIVGASPLRTLRAMRAMRAMRRRRGVPLAVSALLLVASLAASLYVGSGGAARLLLAFSASGPTGHTTSLPATPTWTLAPTMPPATATATAKPTPAIVGDGSSPNGVTFPPYTGPIADGQGCPSGHAPKPVSWAIHSAKDYSARRANVVALTFDDGPTPYYTPQIIAYLKKTHTPATFFVLGQYAQAYPTLIQREAAAGFTIGIHTWNHPSMTKLTATQRAWQLAMTAKQLHADLGANVCLWLWRPPYGDYNSAIVAQAGSFGLTTVVWNDDPVDWSQPGTMTIVNRVLANVHPGSIILLHDGPAGRAQTLAALPYILSGLKARGLTPVSLPQLLLGYQPPTPTPTATPSPTVAPTPTDTPAPTPSPMP